MLLFVILEGVATAYGAIYTWHCMKRRRALATAGALFLCLAGISMGILLWLYVL